MVIYIESSGGRIYIDKEECNEDTRDGGSDDAEYKSVATLSGASHNRAIAKSVVAIWRRYSRCFVALTLL